MGSFFVLWVKNCLGGEIFVCVNILGRVSEALLSYSLGWLGNGTHQFSSN